MDLKIKIVFCILLFVLLLGCKPVKTHLDNENFKRLIEASEAIIIDMPSNYNFEEIKSGVCEKTCPNANNLTGKFALKYALTSKRFTDDKNAINVPFGGFKCSPINRDFFFTIIVLRMNKNDSNTLSNDATIKLNEVSIAVRDHYVNTISNYLDPPMVKVILNNNQSFASMESLIYEILKGYYLFIEDVSLSMFETEMKNLNNKELDKLKQLYPLELKVTSIDGNEYCDFFPTHSDLQSE
jgi:hypothetical protein